MLAVFLTALLMHPVHETVTEMEWNPQTRRLEVAMRLDAIDEQWLRKRATRTPTPADPGNWELAYLRRHFRISEPPQKGKPDATKYRWIGRDEDKGHVWWFFELEPADRDPPQWIEHRVLFEKESNQANRILLLGTVPARTLILTMQRPRASLIPTEGHDPTSSPATGR